MIKWFCNRLEVTAPDIVESDIPPSPPHFICKPGAELLQSDERERTINHVKRCLSVTSKAWESHYYFAITRFAEIVQEHPASRQHHHARTGGLLDHTLEVLLKAMRLSAGVILPPNAKPEEILLNAERWRFGIFICALLHDIGKLIGDQETVYKDSAGQYIRWQPWHGTMPIGHEYVFRYRQTRGEHIHGLHEKLGITLLPILLSPLASEWLTIDRQLLGQMMDTLAASATGSGVIGEIIRKADRASTAEDLDTNTGVFDDSAKPLHIKILEALQSLVNEGKLKRNMPGAAIWVTDDLTYIVAKSTMEKVRDHLLSAGHKGIPQSPVRLMQILNEHKHTITPENGDVQQAVVNDTNRSWQQKLSFLVMPNEHLWISGIPNVFSGSIEPVDEKGNAVELTSPKVVQGVHDEPPTSPQEPRHPEIALVDEKDPPIKSDSAKKSQTAPSTTQIPTVNVEGVHTEPPKQSQVVEQKAVQLITKIKSTKTTDFNHSMAGSLRDKHEFFRWLINGVKYRRIGINSSGAPLHIIDAYLALISPRIFDLYLDDNKALALGLGKTRNRQLEKIQREFKTLKLHLRTEDGGDFHKIVIKGPRRESTVSAILIERLHFPEFTNFSENPILEL